jgi:hypothetical protein
MRRYQARLTLVKGSNFDSDMPLSNYQEIYNDIVKPPFDIPEMESILETVGEVETSDAKSVESYTFDEIVQNDTTDTFQLSNKAKLLFNPDIDTVSIFSDDLLNVSDTDITTHLKDDLDDLDDLDALSESDASSDNYISDDNSSDATVEFDLDVHLEIPNMPVVMIYQEAHEGIMDSLLEMEELDGFLRNTKEWEERWIAWTFQIIAALTFLQSVLSFTHNDLHTNNIVWNTTQESHIYYSLLDGTIYRVPTYGKIFRIIDFGRSIFSLENQLWVSDDYWPEHDASDQYNFGPFFNN